MQEQTYDPILDVAELPRWRLTSPLRSPDPGLALVLVRDSGPSLTIRSGEEIPSARFGGYRSMFTVDLGEHRLVLDIPLLSRDHTFPFRSRVDLICKVADPAKVVARGIRDMSGALYGHLRKMLRDVARNYDVAEFHDAEQALDTTLNSFTGDDAVRLRDIHVELLVDEDEIATGGREFRDVVRETRLARMRRARHLEMIREEGVDGLIAEIMEKEGPRAALAWIEKSEADKREVRREVMRMVLERGDSDREPFEQTELERAMLKEVLREGDGLFDTATRRGRLSGSLSRALEPAAAESAVDEPAAEAPGASSGTPPGVPPGVPPVRGEVVREGRGARETGPAFGRRTVDGWEFESRGRESRDSESRTVDGRGPADRTPGDGPTESRTAGERASEGRTARVRRRPGADDASGGGRDAHRDAPRRRPASEAPPEDEPLPPGRGATPPRRIISGTSGASGASGAPETPAMPETPAAPKKPETCEAPGTPASPESPGPKVSRVRGTAKRRTTDPGREPR